MPKMFEEKIYSMKIDKSMSEDQKRSALAAIHRKSGVPVSQIQQEYFASTNNKNKKKK